VKPIAKAIYYKLFRLRLRIQFWCADRLSLPKSEVPLPPAILRYRVSELISVDSFLRIGEGCANLIQQHVNEMGIDIANAHRVLDFGCGCGRTIRWFLRDVSTTEFYGVDVDAEAVDWCKRHLKSGHFLVTGPSPPLPYPSEHFKVVYCLSVFTHLNEYTQDIWLAELNRILKPGGVLLLTIFGKNATHVLGTEDRKMLQARGFLYRRSRKLRGLVPNWYQTTFHSREYIMNRLSPWFAEIRYSVVPDGQQDVVVARKVTRRNVTGNVLS
jgi:ubiquinone/menaquinone biosynthesis C-methylase UbiE